MRYSIVGARGQSTTSSEQFTELFCHMFDHLPEEEKEVGEVFLSLTQGPSLVAEYALEFRTIAAGSGWNDLALKGIFHQGLNLEVLTMTAWHDEPLILDFLIDIAIWLDHLLHNRHPHLEMGGPLCMDLPPELLQLGHTKLCEEEREKLWHEHSCFYCGSPDQPPPYSSVLLMMLLEMCLYRQHHDLFPLSGKLYAAC